MSKNLNKISWSTSDLQFSGRVEILFFKRFSILCENCNKFCGLSMAKLWLRISGVEYEVKLYFLLSSYDEINSILFQSKVSTKVILSWRLENVWKWSLYHWLAFCPQNVYLVSSPNYFFKSTKLFGNSNFTWSTNKFGWLWKNFQMESDDLTKNKVSNDSSL